MIPSPNTLPTQQELSAVFKEAAELIFHPTMVNALYPFRKGLGYQKPPENDAWANAMAELHIKSSAYRDFIAVCWTRCIQGLLANDPQYQIAEFRRNGMPLKPAVEEIATQCRIHLLDHVGDLKWLGLVYFCLSRAIASTAKVSYSADQRADFTVFAVSLDKAFMRGDGKAFGRLMTQEMPRYMTDVTELPTMLGQRVALGFASMVSLDPDALFFQGFGSHAHYQS